MILVTTFAARHARVAEDAIAARAVEITFAAYGCFALLAGPPLVITDRGSAVGALHTVPIGKRHIGAVRVVGSQQIRDNYKEVEQPTLLQGMANRLATFTLADGFAIDVRMSDAVVGCSGMGVHRDHPIVVGMTVCQIAPVQMDLEGTKINTVQFDWLRGDGDRPFSLMEGNFVELLAQRNQIGVNVTD